MYVFYPQVQMFFTSIKEQALQLAATQLALDNMQKNILWYKMNIETLRTWLDEQMNWSQGSHITSGLTLQKHWGVFFLKKSRFKGLCNYIKE